MFHKTTKLLVRSQTKLQMKIELMTKEDFFEIKRNLEFFWGDRYKFTENLHHPMLFYEFGKTAYVIKEESKIVGYLMGLLPQTSNVAYVHLIAVASGYQRKKYGSSLYSHFMDFAKSNGYKKVKAITKPTSEKSINFHRKIGMNLLGETNQEGLPVIKNYSGEGQDRVVFMKEI